MEKEALEFAAKAHASQQRKYTLEPYIEHPKRLAATLKNVPHTEEMIAAAYLHDVVEDTPVTLEEIRRKFGGKVAQLVAELTDEFVKEKYPQYNRRYRKKKEVARQAKISAEAKTIKLADIIDNSTDIVKNDPNFAPKYLAELEAMLQVMKEGDPELFERARYKIEIGKEILAKQRNTTS